IRADDLPTGQPVAVGTAADQLARLGLLRAVRGQPARPVADARYGPGTAAQAPFSGRMTGLPVYSAVVRKLESNSDETNHLPHIPHYSSVVLQLFNPLTPSDSVTSGLTVLIRHHREVERPEPGVVAEFPQMCPRLSHRRAGSEGS